MDRFIVATKEAVSSPGCPAVFGLMSTIPSSTMTIDRQNCRVGSAARDGQGRYQISEFRGAVRIVVAGPDDRLETNDDHGFECPRGSLKFEDCKYACHYITRHVPRMTE
jgi:hypothetical protein